MPSYINGPVNFVQLEGNINNIQKNITIFMDVHLDLNNQTRCESFDSIDISQYLYNQIKTTKISLDFFLEIRDEQLQQQITNKRDIYIKDVIEMFKSEFIIEKDKVKYSKSNSNVRLHYLDIRDHLNIFYIGNQINNIIIPKLNSLKNDVLTDNILTDNILTDNILTDNILTDNDKINILEQIKTHINKIKKYITNIFENKNNIQQNQIFDKKSQKYYLNKMIHKYEHTTLKTKINLFFNMITIDYMGKLHNIIFKIFEYIILYKNDLKNIEYINEILLLVDSLNTNILKMYTFFTDIYFLRRFLDKDYIQNVITYCGRYHALNYIFFLVKYCKFKINKIYNTNGLSIDNIVNKIIETNDLNDIYNLFLVKGEKPKQCIVDIPIEEIMLID
jgi:hypothetical protein